MAASALQAHSIKVSSFREVANNLSFPEGPVYRPDGSLLVVEIEAGCLSRIATDGTRSVVAKTGGGPNGAAIGPDGAVYVCNDGGFNFVKIGGINVAMGQPPDYSGGRIERVAVDGTVTVLYKSFPLTLATGTVVQQPLCSPDDLVFDRSGNFWFTDWGKARERDRDVTGVYYAKPDGSSIEEKIYPLQSPNGIGLSPKEDRLYVAESFTRRILYWELDADNPGVIKKNPKTMDGSYLLTAKIPYQACLDSMAIDGEGNVYVASFLPHGNDPESRGGVTVVSPVGEILEWIEIDIGEPDPFPSNVCFGGPGRTTMYVTMSGTGRVIACETRIPGKKPAFGMD
jgi:gluconolactonase